MTDVSFYVEVSAGNEVYIPTNEEYTEEVLRETQFQIKDVVKNMDHSGLEDDEIGTAKRFLEQAIAILSKSKMKDADDPLNQLTFSQLTQQKASPQPVEPITAIEPPQTEAPPKTKAEPII